MKNILKKLSILSLLIGFSACEIDDNNTVIQLGDSPTLVSPEEGTNYVLDPVNPTNPAITVVWNHAKYSVGTEVNYTVEIAKSGTEFELPVVLQTTQARQITLTMEQFNQKVLDAGLIPFTPGNIDIRVKGALGTSNAMEVISNEIGISVTPFTTELPKLAVPGNHQGWNPPTAPRLAASAFGETNYEGFVWLDGGFKFVAPDAAGEFKWGNVDYGDDGSFSGVLAKDNESDITMAAGYYRIRVNTGTKVYSDPNFPANSYEVSPVSWGIIGAATPTGWDSDTDLIYNPTTKKLEITSINLVPGPFKFRGNNAWSNGFDLGTVDADGFLVAGGDLSFAGPAGNYKVVLDLSNPRKYTYSITPN